MDTQTLYMFIYTLTLTRVCFYNITITYTHSYMLSYLDTHTLLHTHLNVNLATRVYFFLGSPIIRTHPRVTCSCLSIPSALHSIFDHKFRSKNPI